MVTVLDFLQPIFPFAFFTAWMGTGFALYFRMRRKAVAYLRRFPPVDRYQTLDMYLPGLGFPRGTRRRIQDAFSTPQTDPELERHRKEIWHDSHLMALWVWGFPLATLGVVALLTVTGLVHPR